MRPKKYTDDELKEHRNLYNKTYYKNNSDKIKCTYRNWCDDNKEKRRVYAKEYHLLHYKKVSKIRFFDVDEITIGIKYRLRKEYITLLFDKDDYDLLCNYTFIPNPPGYIQCRKMGVKNKQVMVHRMIMSCPNGKEIDHINGCRYDNRKSNLRICTHLENTKNRRSTKKYKGVYKNNFAIHGSISNYYAQIRLNGKNKHVASCNTEKEAALAYNEAAIKYYGDFARLNIIE